jgi:outer membrane protein OmpA-like peptidoglycan-associated protein
MVTPFQCVRPYTSRVRDHAPEFSQRGIELGHSASSLPIPPGRRSGCLSCEARGGLRRGCPHADGPLGPYDVSLGAGHRSTQPLVGDQLTVRSGNAGYFCKEVINALIESTSCRHSIAVGLALKLKAGSLRMHSRTFLAGLLFMALPSSCAVAQDTRYDLNGEWQAEYNQSGEGLKIEQVMIEHLGDNVIGTKITGDAFVPAGKLTIRGTYGANPFVAEQMCAQRGFSNPRFGKATVQIVDETHLIITRPQGDYCLAGVDHWERVGKTTIALDNSILFDFDKADLKPASQSTISSIITLLADKHPTSHLLVAGYTDNRGSDAHNLQLSKRRAKAVSAALGSAGINADRLSVEGYGKKNARYPNTNDEARSHNRRVEVVVLN